MRHVLSAAKETIRLQLKDKMLSMAEDVTPSEDVIIETS